MPINDYFNNQHATCLRLICNNAIPDRIHNDVFACSLQVKSRQGSQYTFASIKY